MIKKVYKTTYAHKTNIAEFLLDIPANQWLRFVKLYINMIMDENSFEIMKYDAITDIFSFIDSPDWLTSSEPMVGLCYRFSPDYTCSILQPKGQIYHSKELFVADSYQGFDIMTAKQRTYEWNQIPNINQLKSKIGYATYWKALLLENGLEV